MAIDLRRGAVTDDASKPFDILSKFNFVKGLTGFSKYNDPTYLGFVLLFDFHNTIDQYGKFTSPLLDKSDTIGTAYNYLIRTKQPVRAAYLKAFIETLQTINTNMPWYWQAIEGGENMWKYKKMKDPYRGGEESKITISCLESIDLKMTMLMDLYRKAIYDQDYRRIVIPQNLLKFNVTVVIQEVRKFHSQLISPAAADALRKLAGVAPNAFVSNITDPNATYLEGNTPYLRFTLQYCEFIDDDSSTFMEGLNMMHGTADQAKQKVTIQYENITEPANLYQGFGTVYGGDILEQQTVLARKPSDSADVTVGSDSGSPTQFSNVVKQVTQRAAVNIINAGEEFVSGQTARLLLGNVYGLNPTNLSSALAQGSVLSLGPAVTQTLNSIQQVGSNPGQALGKAFDSTKTSLGDEALGSAF